MQDWWKIIAQHAGVSEWRLIGEIGRWAELSAVAFNEQLQKLEAKHQKLLIKLHCGGGSIYEGLQMYQRLKESSADIQMDVEGIAASMGSVLLMGAEKRRISKYGRLMIHQGSGRVSGSAAKIQTYAQELSDNNAKLAAIYAEAIQWKHPERDPQWVLDNWMSEGKDTWLNAEQALKEGLVHEIYDGVIKKPPSAAYSQEEQAAYYDSHLIQEEPGTHEPQGLGEPITNHDMDKNKIIVLFAQAGIPLGEQVSASTEDTSFLAHMQQKIQGLKAQADKLEALQATIDQQANEQLDKTINTAVQSGKINEAQAEKYRALGKTQRETVIALLAEIPEPVDLEAKVKGAKAQKQKANDKDRENWNYAEWEQKDPKGLMALADEDPSAYEALAANYEPADEEVKNKN